jgi:hypothetical protein
MEEPGWSGGKRFLEENKISWDLFTAEEQEAVSLLSEGLRGLYGSRLTRAILFGRKSRGRKSSDIDVLLILETMESLRAEIVRVSRITEPITSERDILITAIPVDRNELEKRKEMPFFAKILENGIDL